MWGFPENPHGWRNRNNDENINGQSVNQLLLLAKDDRNNLGIAHKNQDTDKKIIGKYKPIEKAEHYENYNIWGSFYYW